jgi:hypothetical protein
MKTLSELLEVLGWTPRYLADYLGLNDRNVRRWVAENPDTPVPDNIYRWLYVLAEVHEMCPFPDGWVNHRDLRTAEVLASLSRPY